MHSFVLAWELTLEPGEIWLVGVRSKRLRNQLLDRCCDAEPIAADGTEVGLVEEVRHTVELTNCGLARWETLECKLSLVGTVCSKHKNVESARKNDQRLDLCCRSHLALSCASGRSHRGEPARKPPVVRGSQLPRPDAVDWTGLGLGERLWAFSKLRFGHCFEHHPCFCPLPVGIDPCGWS